MPVQVPGHLRQRLGRQQAADEVIHREGIFLLEKLIQPGSGAAVGTAQFIRIGSEETAPFEKGTAFPFNQLTGTAHNGIHEQITPGIAVHHRVPAIAQRREIFRKAGLVQTDRILIAAGQFHLLPIGPEILVHAGAHCNEVGLDVFRNKTVFAEPAAAHGIMTAQPPEIQLLTAVHPREHLFQRANRSGQSVVHQNHFIKGPQFFLPDVQQRLAVSTYIQPLVFPFQDRDILPLQPCTAIGVQSTVMYKQKDPCLFPHGSYRKTAGRIGLPAGVIMEIDHESVIHIVYSSYGAPCGPKTARLVRIMPQYTGSGKRSRSQLRVRRRLLLE